MRAEWSHAAVRAFAKGCSGLNLHGKTIADVEAAARSMPMLSFLDGDVPVGGAVFHGEQVHIAVIEEFRGKWATKPVLAAFRESLKNCRKALINPTNGAAARFAIRMGWKRTGSERGYDVYSP